MPRLFVILRSVLQIRSKGFWSAFSSVAYIRKGVMRLSELTEYKQDK